MSKINTINESHSSEDFNIHQGPLQETVYMGHTIDVNPEVLLLRSKIPQLQELGKDISYERNQRIRETAEHTTELVRKNIVIEKLGIDAVTGLATRPIFDRDLGAYAKRNDPGTALIVYDLLGLNRVNDDEEIGGHDVGDKYLSVATGAIMGTGRPGDRDYRLAGDEIGTILSGLSPDADGNYDKALQAVIDNKKQAILEALQEAELPVDQLYLGVSAGGVVLDGKHQMTDDEMFKAADVAMFDDKREFYGSLPEDVQAKLKKTIKKHTQ